MVSTGLYESKEASRALTSRSLKHWSNSNATTDVAGAPLGFGDVMFSEAATPVVPFVAPVVDAQAEAFLA
jgi:hypothetical protein